MRLESQFYVDLGCSPREVGGPSSVMELTDLRGAPASVGAVKELSLLRNCLWDMGGDQEESVPSLYEAHTASLGASNSRCYTLEIHSTKPCGGTRGQRSRQPHSQVGSRDSTKVAETEFGRKKQSSSIPLLLPVFSRFSGLTSAVGERAAAPVQGVACH